MNDFDLLPRGVLQGTVEMMLMDRATLPESRELLGEVLSLITSMPAADVVPVVHAHWRGGNWCSRCGAVKPQMYHSAQPGNEYCHMCTAKMDGGSDETK